MVGAAPSFVRALPRAVSNTPQTAPDVAPSDGAPGDSGLPPEELTVDELERQVVSLAGQIAAMTARWLLLLAEFDRREAWSGVGVRSCAHWLNLHCGMSLGAGREHVRAAHALAGLPVTREAFLAGQLSYSKVRAITRVASVADEEALVDLARNGSASQVERIVRAYRKARNPDEIPPEPDHFVRWHYAEDGTFVASLRVPPEVGAAWVALLEHARDELFADITGTRTDAADPSTADPSTADPSTADSSTAASDAAGHDAAADADVQDMADDAGRRRQPVAPGCGLARRPGCAGRP